VFNVLETQLEDYILEEELGRDDLSIVYRGRRKSDEATVAIKIVAPQFTFDEFFIRRFQELARQTTRLEHPNVVRTYEVRQENDLLYVVQELVTVR
jgi:eukaryotic-like serine/threonine-protein kinase